MSAGTEEVEVLSVRPTPPSQAEETVKTEPLNNVTDISPSLSPEIEDVQHLLSETPVPFSIDRVGAQDNINEDLTPPPDSPVELYEPVEEPTDGNVEDHQHTAMDQTEDASTLEDNMSVVSSPAAVNGLEDEIVVGTKVNSKASPGPGPSDQEDVILEDDGQESYLGLVKRKRSTDDEDDSLLDGEEGSTAPAEDVDQNQSFSHLATVQSTKSSRGVVLGYWRDSQIEDGADKHAVSGFLDRKERLRTKVHYVSRDGRPINSDEYPLPPGPGGSWCTFDKIVFEDHLVGLNQLVVKAYVKLLATDPDFMENGESPADKEEAVRLAQEWVEEHGGPETQQNTIAYGAFIPEHAVTQSKQPASQAVTQPKPVQKRRKVAGPPADPEPAIQPPPPISGTRPTSVVLGYWKGSDVHDSVDKHAVLGILGANEMFRLKISRTTRDGQVVGSFPAGAGALWIQWEDCEFEPHLKRLSRAEIKEYCRIRQLQIDQGESPEERITNELQAKEEARQRVRQQYASGIPAGRSEADKSSSMTRSRFSLANGAQNGHEGTNGALITPQSEEPRQPRQAALKGRHSLPNVEFQAANRSRPASLATEKTQAQAAREATRLNSLALQGMVRIEAKQAKLDQRATNHPSAASGATAADQFGQNIARLQRVWASQEANRIRADGDDSKMHMGVKYERKQTGPFQGKLVSHGSLISIDGEDYVEYRVLMKPTFF